MGAARPLLSFLAMALVAAGIVLQFFVLLSGTRAGTPTTLTYFLQASTTGIDGARDPSRWTYWSICGADGDFNTDCGASVPALPFDPPSNFGTDTGVPEEFIGTRHYYLISRFAWVFYLVGLLFAVITLITSLLALCTRLGAYIASFNCIVAFLFQGLASALMTVWAVQGRNAFLANDQDAQLGRYGFGFSWGPVFAFLLATVLFCLSSSAGRKSRRSKRTTNKEYVHDTTV